MSKNSNCSLFHHKYGPSFENGLFSCGCLSLSNRYSSELTTQICIQKTDNMYIKKYIYIFILSRVFYVQPCERTSSRTSTSIKVYFAQGLFSRELNANLGGHGTIRRLEFGSGINVTHVQWEAAHRLTYTSPRPTAFPR